MFRPPASLAMLACAFALIAPATAMAQDPPAEVPDIAVSEPQPVTTGPSYGIATASSTPRLWATVNICDTAEAPDSMGIRAGMPGGRSGQRMFMRFRAEYWSRGLQDWAPVAGTGTSPWVYAGPGRYERRQSGWTFHFAPPPEGVTFTMRAIVEFEWRKRVPVGSARRKGTARRERSAGGKRATHRKRTSRGNRAAHRKRTTRGNRAAHRKRTTRHNRSAHRNRKRTARRGFRSLVVRSVTRTTETGIRGVDGGDPAGTSKAMCLIY
jgi:hypothetical protein